MSPTTKVSTNTSLYAGVEEMPFGNPDTTLNTIRSHAGESNEYLSIKKPIWQRVHHLYRQFRKDPMDPQFKGSDFFVVLDMYAATDKSDQQLVEFSSVDNNPANKDKARFITGNWENDFEQGRYADQESLMKTYMGLTGLGVLYFNGWNSEKLLPSLISVPTENVLMDPVGGKDPQNHRWVGFAMRYNLADMVADRKNFIPKVVEDYLANPYPTQNEYTQEVEEEENRMAGLDTYNTQASGEGVDMGEMANATKNTPGLGYVDVYDIYIVAQDKKFLVTCDQNMNRIFRVKELKPINPSGRQNVMDIEYPVIFRQFMPVFDSDPCGIAPYELVSHDQLNKSTMINLAKERIYKNLSSAMMVKAGSVDADDLSHDKNEVTQITLQENEKLSDVAQFTPVAPVPLNEMMTMIDLFNRQVADSTGVNDISLGNSQAEVETLGEVEIRSQNLNTRNRKRLEESIETRKRTAQLWFRQYQRHFKEADSREKTIQIQVGKTAVPYNITPQDFNSDIPSITVTSLALEAQDNRKKVKTLYSMLNSLQAMGDQEGMVNVIREILMKDGGVDESVVDEYVAQNPIIEIVKMENEVLAENVPLELLPEDDVMIRLRYQSRIPTDAGRQRYQDLVSRATEQMLEQQMAQQGATLQQEVRGGGAAAPGTEVRMGEGQKEEQFATEAI